MEVIVNEGKVISLAEVDANKHFIVAMIDIYPCIGHQDWGNSEKFRFYTLNKNFTKGNHYLKVGNIKTVIKQLLAEGQTVEVFDNYKDALRWLIDNGNQSN